MRVTETGPNKAAQGKWGVEDLRERPAPVPGGTTAAAIGVMDGKVCFYSLSNFIMSSTAKSPAKAAEFARQYGVVMDPDYPHLPYGGDAKRSLIARAVLSRDGATRVSFLPVLIDRELRPEVLRRGDARFDDALRFMEWVSEDHPHRFTVEGDEVVVSASNEAADKRR